MRSSSAPRSRPARTVFATRSARGKRAAAKASTEALGEVELVGYSRRRLAPAGVPLNIVVGRPHSIGGRRLACLRYSGRAYGVDSMDASIARLKSLVDACDDAPILFLAHNGPSGLGDRADSIWGCDFRRKEEDWGDRDLEEAVRYANSNGRKVLATVAGHMHRRDEVRKESARAGREGRRAVRERGGGAAAPRAGRQRSSGTT